MKTDNLIPKEQQQEIVACLPQCELLCQLAEECAELGKAALKLRRALDGTNPTPRPQSICVDDLIEESADVLLLLHLLGITEGCADIVGEICREKAERWVRRLSGEVDT